MNPTTVFKFCPAECATAILKHKSIFITSPLDLNDPFEMRPAWTDDHARRSRQNLQVRNDAIAGLPIFFAGDETFTPRAIVPQMQEPEFVPAEHHRGTSDRDNDKVFQLLHAQYRILCFATGLFNPEKSPEEHEAETLLWAHYADSFQGVCLAIDPTQLNQGIREGGFPVDYSPTRIALPVGYYDSYFQLNAETVEMDGVEYQRRPDSALLMTEEAYREKVRDQLIAFLTQKSPAWKYEKELRMIYDLESLRQSPDYSQPRFRCKKCDVAKRPVEQCRIATFRDAIAVPASAIRAVIFGTDTGNEHVTAIFDILGAPDFTHVDLYWSSLRADRYIVDYEKGDWSYIRGMQNVRVQKIARAKDHSRIEADGKWYLWGAKKTQNYVPGAWGDCDSP